jgi:hypothetical protein
VTVGQASIVSKVAVFLLVMGTLLMILVEQVVPVGQMKLVVLVTAIIVVRGLVVLI